LLVLDLNIIFNLLHPSNHFQTLTNFTLDPPSFTVNPLEVAQHKLHTLIHLNSSSPSPCNERWRRESWREMEIPLFFNHLCYAKVWVWYQNYNYIDNLFLSLIMNVM